MSAPAKSTCPALQPYKNRADYLRDLDAILETDYGAKLSNAELEKSAVNIDCLLGAFL